MLRKRLKQILILGTPLLGSHLAMYLYRLADAVMVGRLGVTPLAAIAIATLYTNVHEMFVWPVALGTQAITSRRFGRAESSSTAGDSDEVVTSGLVAGLIAGSGASILALAAPFLLPLLSPELARLAVPYVLINAASFPLIGAASALRGYLSAVHRTRIVMVGIVSSNLLNIALNAVFIFGLAGMPALGVTGAAIGTVGARVLNLLVLGAATIGSVNRSRPTWALTRRILLVGAPVAIQNAIAMTVVLLYQAMLGTIGAVYQAVTHVVFSTFRINKTLVGGYANASSILVGNALGRDDQTEAIDYFRAQQVIGIGVGLFVCVVVLTLPATLARAFDLEGQAFLLAVRAFRFFAPFFLIEIAAYSLEIIFTHNGWGRFVLMSEAITNVIGIIALPAAAIFLFSLGYWGAWAGFVVYQVGHAAILYAGYLSRRWISIDVEGNV